ncbi:MAG: (2Fe-2S)-binding protein [Methylococcus sp.]|nr:(2Fe-2S)-binding protein [Methylococcus sp.]
MSDAIPAERKNIICRCSGTTAQQIRRQFDKGVTDIDEISRATGASSGCGACDADILALLAEYLLIVSPGSVDA